MGGVFKKERKEGGETEEKVLLKKRTWVKLVVKRVINWVGTT